MSEPDGNDPGGMDFLFELDELYGLEGPESGPQDGDGYPAATPDPVTPGGVLVEDEPPQPLDEMLREFLQEALNARNDDLGVQVVGDFYLVAEVHTGSHTYLRLLGSDSPLWKHQGMLHHALQGCDNEALGFSLREERED